MNILSRREFIAMAGGAVAGCSALPTFSMAQSLRGPFRIAVINDEISPDFDHACYVASHEFGMSWIELRSMWGKNVMDLDAAQIDEVTKDSEQIQPSSDRYRQSAFQNRLAGRA